MEPDPEMPHDLEAIEYTVTCTTAGCTNEGIALVVLAPVDTPRVVCGLCTTDLDPTLVDEGSD